MKPIYPPNTKIRFKLGRLLNRAEVVYMGYYQRPGHRNAHWVTAKRTKSAVAGWWVPTEDILGEV